MTGTLVNAAAVAAGGLLGLLFKKNVKPSLSEACMKAVGAATVLIGIAGALAAMFRVNQDGSIASNGGLFLLISLVFGTLIGELIRLHDHMESLSGKLETAFHLTGFSKGFVDASVLFCAGAMTIVGSLNDGLYGDSSVLFIKSAIDFFAALFLAAALGVGVPFSALFVLLFQGAITLSAGLLAPVLTPAIMNALSAAGFAIVLCIGLNLMGIAKIKTTNMVFALPVAVLLALLPFSV